MAVYKRKINYYETDKMGIVHHSNYIRYFEEARLFWMEEAAISYAFLEQQGIVIPVTFVDCQYKTPVRYGDIVEIAVHPACFDGVKLEYSYEICDASTGELRTTGRSGHCILNREMKPMLLRREFPQLYEQIMQAVCADGGKCRGRWRYSGKKTPGSMEKNAGETAKRDADGMKNPAADDAAGIGSVTENAKADVQNADGGREM